jgi:hypothetical protein
MDNAWDGCSGLTEFPYYEFPASNSVDAVWSGCTGLTSFPPIKLGSALTGLNETWYGCSGLTEFPLISGLDNVNSCYSAWQECTGLVAFPSLKMPRCYDFGGTWLGCSALTSFPDDADLGSLAWENNDDVDVSEAWLGCTSLTSFNGLALLPRNTADLWDAWRDCTSLTKWIAPQEAFTEFDDTSGTWQNTALDQESVDGIIEWLAKTAELQDLTGETISFGSAGARATDNDNLKALVARGFTITYST